MKRTDIKPIGQVIREHLQRLDESGKLSETIALTAVDDVLGKEFASLIKDRRIENGVLFLKTDSAALRSELFASRSQLMQKLNEKTGKDIIKDVRIN
jgi:predicted nucleic acid-binding Zn ribbon protein